MIRISSKPRWWYFGIIILWFSKTRLKWRRTFDNKKIVAGLASKKWRRTCFWKFHTRLVIKAFVVVDKRFGLAPKKWCRTLDNKTKIAACLAPKVASDWKTFTHVWLSKLLLLLINFCLFGFLIKFGFFNFEKNWILNFKMMKI